eukprot:gene9043-16166_t
MAKTYCRSVLPAPETLTQPFCWTTEQRSQLQHEDICSAAVAQQARLEALFPDFAVPVAPGLPTWFQWAFACVRSRAFNAAVAQQDSLAAVLPDFAVPVAPGLPTCFQWAFACVCSRAFKLSDDCFGLVPFLDLANHVVEPNADFLVTKDGDIQIVALKPIKKDEEVTFSYTGPAGYTNQRLMAQYGFVIPGGNPGDRVNFKVEEGFDPLQMDTVQSSIGDQFFTSAISGQDQYLYAALKSVPLVDSMNDSSSAEASVSSSPGRDDRALAGELLRQCDEMISEMGTSLDKDLDLLDDLGSKPDEPGQLQYMSAVLYRVERKKLLRACR